MVFTVDPGDAGAISGLPFAAARALERRGCTIVPLEAASVEPSDSSGQRARLKRFIPKALHEWPARLRSMREGCVIDGALAAADRVARRLAVVRREREIDALVGMCVSVPLAFLQTDLPIVYASDATARIILTSYPRYARRAAVYRRECEECEQRALAKSSAVALASDVAVHSATNDYGIDPRRVHLVPLGSHVLPDETVPIALTPPTRAKLTLLIVASDPERKRIGLAVETVAMLRGRGINAELLHIGAHDRCLRRPFVRTLGPLRLAHRADRARHIAAIRDAHLSILPSSGEAFGIAPAESALAGRPAIVSDAGGLPTVVRDGETGIVLPLAAGSREWADAIEGLLAEPERYCRLAEAARTRAWREFTWDAWATKIEALARRACRERDESFDEGHDAVGRAIA